MKNPLRRIFSALLAFCALSTALFAKEPAPPQNPVPAAAPSVPAPEKLFYAATLNESVFVNGKETLYNARATVKVLQGTLDAVVFEAVGQGDVVSVNGEQVRDWSVRRAGTRTFLEIRPKKSVGIGEEFTAIIVGKKSLELPATIQPMIFTGTDATSFNGMVRIEATEDIRLYGKQSRGLIPVGTPTKNELSFSVSGTPSLRLDIARGNELLAPVSLESFSLVGDVRGDSAHFRIRAVASVRELDAEIAVLSGDAALCDFAESSAFAVRAEIHPEKKTPTYFLKFPKRGDFDINLEFDARVVSADEWKRFNFSVPAIQVAPFRLEGLNGEIFFAPSSVSVPQPRDGGYAGYLPANGNFDLRWQEISGTPPEFSACIFSANSVGEWRVEKGVLSQCREIALTISQGALSSLVFDLFGEGEILDVAGADVLSWEVEKFDVPADSAAPAGRLNVVLGRRKSGDYTLRVKTTTRFAAMPATFSPLRVVPVASQPDAAVCVRFNELTRVVNAGSIRMEILPQTGQTQVAAGAFPQDKAFFESDADSQIQAVYRIANGGNGMRLTVSEIRPDVSVFQTTRCYFSDNRVFQITTQRLKIRSAPIYEWNVRVPEDCVVESVFSELLASREISEAAENGFRDLRFVFTEPLTGEHQIRFATSKPYSPDSSETCSLRGPLSPQARFVQGFVGFSTAKKLRPVPVESDGLSEVPPEFYPQTSGTLPQQVFRIRDANWNANVYAGTPFFALHGNVSSVYEIAAAGIRGNALIRVENDFEPIETLVITLPRNAKFLGVENADDFFEPNVSGSFVALQLRTPRRGEFAFRVNFEFPESAGKDFLSADFSGVGIADASGEQGEIFITSDCAVALMPENDVHDPAVAAILRENVPAEMFAGRGGKILLDAYQYVRRPFVLDFAFRPLAERTFPQCVITRATGKIAPWEIGFYPRFRYEYLSEKDSVLEFALPKLGWRKTVPIERGRGEIEVSCDTLLQPNSDGSITFEMPSVNVPVLTTRIEGPGEFRGAAFRNGRTPIASFGELCAKLATAFSAINVLLPVICVFAGTFALRLATRSRGFMHFILAFVCTAAFAGTLFLGAMFLRNGLSPHYAESVICFGAGGQVSAEFVPWISLGEEHRIQIVLGGAIGLLLLSVGAVWKRSRILRILGRIAFYGAIVFITRDVAHCVPALVAVLVAAELLLAIISIFFALKKRFSKKSDGDSAPKKTSLPAALVAGTLALISLFAGTPELRAENAAAEKTLTVAAELARPQNIAELISQEIRILDDRVVATGKVRVKGKAGDRFDLLASPAVLTHFAKNDEKSPSRLARRRAATGMIYQIVLDGSGTFSADFGYELALSRDALGMTLPTGIAAADVVIVSSDRRESRLSAEGAVTLSSVTAEDASQRAEIVFKPLETRRILWNPRERNRAGEPLALYAESANLYVPGAGTIEGFHEIRLTPARGEFSKAGIRVPAGFSVSRVDGAAIRRWNFGRDNVLTVLFDAKKSETASLTVRTQAPLGVVRDHDFSSLEISGCAGSVRTVGIATGDDLQIDSCDAPELTVMDAREFPAALLDSAAQFVPEASLRRAFRSVAGEAKFRVALSEVKPDVRVVSQERLMVGRDKVLLLANINVSATRAEVFNLSFRLPDGFEVEFARGNALAYWAETQESVSERKVTLFMKQSLSAEENFCIALSGPFPSGAPVWTAPKLVFNDVQNQRGEVRIFANDNLKLQLRSRTRAVELPADEAGVPAAVAETEPAALPKTPDFAFRYGDGKWKLAFAVSSAVSQARAHWTQKIEPAAFSRYARVETHFVCGEENASRRVLRVRIPPSALAPWFFGEFIVAAAPVNAAENSDAGTVWEIRFSRPISDEIDFNLVYFEALSRTTTFSPVGVLDVAEERGEVRVVPGGVFCVPEDAALARGTAFSSPLEIDVEEHVVSDWRRMLSGISEGSFSCLRLDRFSQVFKDSFVNFDVREIEVRRPDLLRIVPAGAEILSVRLNGVPASLFEDEDAFYLPILPSGKSTTARLEILSRGKFSEEMRIAAAPRTSAFPKRVRWIFSANVPVAKLRVKEIFGLPAEKVARADVPENSLPAFFAFPMSEAFETARVSRSRTDAKIVFEAENPPQGTFFERVFRRIFGE